jgi:SEC-C motif-containing protein
MDCPCGSGTPFETCCEPVLTGARPAPTAEACMRARYTAYTRVAMDYVLESTHPDFRDDYDPENARRWAEQAEWHGLEVLATEAGGPADGTGTVEFLAAYTLDGDLEHYHEIAEFERLDGRWYFREGRPGTRKPVTRDAPKVGRNDPCPCGSGRKHKRCCGA